ncbi:SOS response-associated peptidase [Polaromonas sp.]|uniref:SOS response-associated peptidase n=1 Tax=Polaromonas sp. TaxID=1869339 RepID=UPI001859A2BD|nr:SOS response-associated peptidase [Polaromonas sp.]NML86589.1 SOS response-associated peptidase [Polaromonas sp.]
MCSHYQAMKDRERYRRHFGVEPPDDLGKFDVWPLYAASFIRRPLEADAGDEAVPHREALPGQFGLIPHWATDTTIARRTFNARSETVATKPSFRDAWRNGQRCIIPVEAFYEPDWRSGRAVPTRIIRADGEPMGIAGLWSWWKSGKGELVHSFAMLTINADQHALMRDFHKPGDEKRMVVILPSGAYDEWLNAPPAQTDEFLRQYPAERLVEFPAPR